MTETQYDPWQHALAQLDAAARRLELDERVHALLRTPQRELGVALPLQRDDGRFAVLRGWRVHHNLALGPGKGGIRYHADVTLEEVRALAMWMSWKCSLAGLPYGGAKGGVAVDPQPFSEAELERLTRRYCAEVARLIGPMLDIPAPDVNTSARVMGWLMDAYSLWRGESSPAVVTGKPLELGGSLGRTEATARGLVHVAAAVAPLVGVRIAGASVAIQGFGNVGSIAARLLAQAGARVVAISDSHAALRNEKGLDVAAAIAFKRERRTLEGFPEADRIPLAELLELPCDLLVPAALENQLTASNAARVRARLVAEGANGPTTPEADRILAERGIPVAPDILANSGGVIVSSFEWMQNLQQETWSEDEVNERLEKQILAATQRVLARAKERRSTLREAAFDIAVERVARAVSARGFLG